MSNGFDNLNNAASGMRKANIAPPPPVPPGTQEPTQPQNNQTRPKPSKKTSAAPSKKRKTKTTDTDNLPGKKVGAQHYLRVNLSNTAREHLQNLADTTNTSLGEQAIAALGRHHTTITSEANAAHTNRGGLTPPRQTTRRLVGGGNKIATTIGLTPEEAKAVDDLQQQTNYSYSLLFDRALNHDTKTQ